MVSVGEVHSRSVVRAAAGRKLRVGVCFCPQVMGGYPLLRESGSRLSLPFTCRGPAQYRLQIHHPG
jgi:hypothetical protein